MLCSTVMEGAEQALILGDPDGDGTRFTIRYRTTQAIDVAAHWHPGDEEITVIEAPFSLGFGDVYDCASLISFKRGSSFVVPKGVRHFARYLPGTVVEVSGVAPFQINYVDPPAAIPGRPR